MKRIKLVIALFALVTLYACGNGGMDEEAPVIEGVQDKAITVGADFDPLQGITATDAVDGDLTQAISVEGTYDLSTAGEYDLVLKVVDEAGNETEQPMKLTVSVSPYGTVKGNITYNETSRPDTDSRVLLIPQAADFTEMDVTMYLYGARTDSDLGIYSTHVDGNGNYELADVEPGDYFIFVQSENTQNRNLTPMDTSQLTDVLSDSNLELMLVDAGYSNGVIEPITVEAGNDVDFDHDFGY